MGLFSNKKEEKKEMPAMPAPSTSPNGPNLSVPPKDDISDAGKLVSPPMPGSKNLEDIKALVTSSPNQEMKQPEIKEESTKIDDIDSESLFDLSEIDFPEPGIEKSNTDSIESNKTQEKLTSNDSTIDTNLETPEKLNFIAGRRNNKNTDASVFVTTSQFKAMLEIIDQVKNRVKETSELHLRLMDIKAEEDIEYENLRKSFQFIEDKLYEVDSLIFEK